MIPPSAPGEAIRDLEPRAGHGSLGAIIARKVTDVDLPLASSRFTHCQGAAGSHLCRTPSGRGPGRSHRPIQTSHWSHRRPSGKIQVARHGPEVHKLRLEIGFRAPLAQLDRASVYGTEG